MSKRRPVTTSRKRIESFDPSFMLSSEHLNERKGEEVLKLSTEITWLENWPNIRTSLKCSM